MQKKSMGVVGLLAAVVAASAPCGAVEKNRSEDRPLQQRSPEAGSEKGAQVSAQTPTVGEKTAGMQKLAGYFNLYWDGKQGKPAEPPDRKPIGTDEDWDWEWPN